MSQPLPNHLEVITRPEMANRAQLIKSLGTFPEIPSIKIDWSASTSAEKVKVCKEWFTEFMSRTDASGKRVHIPDVSTAAGEYLEAAGDAGEQTSRMTEMIGYICEHDAKARQIVGASAISFGAFGPCTDHPDAAGGEREPCECKPECDRAPLQATPRATQRILRRSRSATPKTSRRTKSS